MSLGDSIHLATALQYSATELQATLLFGEPITPEEATKTLEDTNEPIKTLPPPAEVQGSPAGPPASEAGVKSAEAGKPEGSQDGQVATATVGKEEVAPTESKTPAGVKPAGDAKGGS